MKDWFFRKIWLPLYGRWALRYARKARRYAYAGIRVQAPPGVFHPGLYFSTNVLIDYLKNVPLQRKQVLDMGCGSGMLGLYAASRGATVVAVDINPEAVKITRQNALENNLNIETLESDLFREISPDSAFELILVNPPYFAAAPRHVADRAFFAGEQLEYFDQFFSTARHYLSAGGCILMILGSGCDLKTIAQMAQTAGFRIETVLETEKWGREMNLWKIE